MDKDNGTTEAILEILKELRERIEELEETGGKAAAELRIINLIYDTDDKHLPGLARLPMPAIQPFAQSMMLRALRDPDVLSGKKTLTEAYMMAYLMLTRSVGGEHLQSGRDLAREKIQSEIERAQGPEINLGEGT